MARLFSPKIDVYHWELLKRLCHDDHKESLEMAIIKKIIGLNTRALPGFWEHLVPHPLPYLGYIVGALVTQAKQNMRKQFQKSYYSHR